MLLYLKKQFPHLKIKLLAAAAYLVLAGALYYWGIPCISKALFSLPCPGCGMTRAYLSLARLDIAAAWHYHPMFWSMPLVFLYILKDGRLLSKKWMDIAVLSLIGAGFLLCWILRLPYFW